HAADQLEYPVMLKATAGGGGKGMREVVEPEQMDHAFATAQAEAEANFKDGRLYMEKLIERPRHVEVQILGDSFGKIVHLGERDCSVQKPSHQKLIEEAPAPNLDPEIRKKLLDTALAAGRAVEYTNAGTLEFLVSQERIYFMEMNTRIQVEHPVTEMLYGVDLVKEQIRIAAGEALGYDQSDLRAVGCAIECRINAEDSCKNFAPAAGTLCDVVFPGGPGIRVDTHVFSGAVMPPYYDSLIAKIISSAPTREAAIARMERALRETSIEGVQTTIDQCLQVLESERFRAGNYGIDFLPILMKRTAAQDVSDLGHFRKSG
ncbi:MAG: acetyl-CoA carboxylase biotin carboxylase subunit, partial [Candidatus Eremiobacteraeota bacterium]|nr:acetyl-CoA carboxylase biotin carboxylase subunit [Candidatus Eremiobacteraeota bacterium]